MNEADSCKPQFVRRQIWVFGAESSMAGKKSVYENAHAEIELFDYIEVYYNRIRKHSALDYMSPEKFEQIYKQNELLNLQSKLSV